jgi:hypothetical protein
MFGGPKLIPVWIPAILVILSTSMQILGYYLKYSQDCFLSDPFIVL